MLRAFALGVAVGIAGALARMIEAVRRGSGAPRSAYALWPRSDGSDQGSGGVWDHGA